MLGLGANGTPDLASTEAQFESSSLVRRALQVIVKAARMQAQPDENTAGTEVFNRQPAPNVPNGRIDRFHLCRSFRTWLVRHPYRYLHRLKHGAAGAPHHHLAQT